MCYSKVYTGLQFVLTEKYHEKSLKLNHPGQMNSIFSKIGRALHNGMQHALIWTDVKSLPFFSSDKTC